MYASGITYTGVASSAGLPGVTDPFVDFTVGDGQPGSPNNGDTFWTVASFQGQSIFNKRLLVIREGIALNWNTPVAANGEIRRYNSGGLGGWTFQGGLFFFAGDRFQVYIIGVNTKIET